MMTVLLTLFWQIDPLDHFSNQLDSLHCYDGEMLGKYQEVDVYQLEIFSIMIK
jgi:hypothetical protein